MTLSLWGYAVGTAVGWQAAGALMGLSSETFFLMFWQMLWLRDVVGMVVKGVCFGFLAAAICCFEGLRERTTQAAVPGQEEPSGRPESGAVSQAIARAACLSIAGMLVANMTWFILVYHAVPVYGPSLLAPPGP